jgi:hypothetical protein
MLGALWFATACGGTERGAAPGVDEERDPGRALVGGTAPTDGVQLGGGQTSDFGDGLGSGCDYVIETVSHEAARAEGWPVDADLALLQPLAEVAVQRQGAGCESELEAGPLRLELDLLEIHRAQGTPIPEAVGRVECEPLLTYGIDFGVHAGDGWIAGQFHVELASDGERLQGSGFQSAEQMQGTLRLHVDQRRPHLARANLALEFTRSELSGELAMEVYYTDQQEPLLQLGERLFWPPVPGARCVDGAPLDDGSGSEWLSIDTYREALRAP